MTTLVTFKFLGGNKVSNHLKNIVSHNVIKNNLKINVTSIFLLYCIEISLSAKNNFHERRDEDDGIK